MAAAAAHDQPARAERAAWVSHAERTLTLAGHRSGAARRAVLDELAADDCCLSAHELFDRLRAEGRRVGIASVYRVLEQLTNQRLVRRFDLEGGVSRYEPAVPSGAHHHHLVCVECGLVQPFHDARLERALGAAASLLAHEVVDHDVVLRGRCAACRAAA